VPKHDGSPMSGAAHRADAEDRGRTARGGTDDSASGERAARYARGGLHAGSGGVRRELRELQRVMAGERRPADGDPAPDGTTRPSAG
jgi:hypothetical protein